MRRTLLNITVVLIFVLLGFMISYKLKMSFRLNLFNLASNNMYDLNALEEEKVKIQKKNDELISQIKRAEEQERNTSESINPLLDELIEYRLLLGLTEAEGPGAVISIKPKLSPFEGYEYISDSEIIYLINELFYASAEAISINDIRVNNQSTIDMKSRNKLLIDNNEVRVDEQLIIKVIGNTESIITDLTNFSFQEQGAFRNYKFDIKEIDNLKISKYSREYKSDDLKSKK